MVRDYRVDRVLGFFSNHPNRDTPLSHPLTRRRVCPPPLWFTGGKHSLAVEGGRGVPIRTRGQILWYFRYICTLCQRCSLLGLKPPLPHLFLYCTSSE